MGPTALLPLRRKACWGFFSPEKSHGFGRVWTRELGYQRPAHSPLDHRSRWLLPLLKQFFLIQTGVQMVCGSQKLMYFFSPPTWIISSGIRSTVGNLYFLQLLNLTKVLDCKALQSSGSEKWQSFRLINMTTCRTSNLTKYWTRNKEIYWASNKIFGYTLCVFTLRQK